MKNLEWINQRAVQYITRSYTTPLSASYDLEPLFTINFNAPTNQRVRVVKMYLSAMLPTPLTRSDSFDCLKVVSLIKWLLQNWNFCLQLLKTVQGISLPCWLVGYSEQLKWLFEMKSNWLATVQLNGKLFVSENLKQHQMVFLSTKLFIQ